MRTRLVRWRRNDAGQWLADLGEKLELLDYATLWELEKPWVYNRSNRSLDSVPELQIYRLSIRSEIRGKIAKLADLESFELVSAYLIWFDKIEPFFLSLENLSIFAARPLVVLDHLSLFVASRSLTIC